MKLLVKVKASMVVFVLGTSCLFLGASNIWMTYPFVSVFETVMVAVDIWLILMGFHIVHMSVKIRHMSEPKSYDEEVNDMLDRPLPKRWRG